MKTYLEKVKENYIYQTNPNLTYPINRFGCRVFCLLAIPQVITGKTLSVNEILSITEQGRNIEGVIVNNEMRTGKNEHWLINKGFEVLGSTRKGRQVGWNPEHITSVKWEYMVVHWKTDGLDGHFTLFDRNQKEIIDPYNPEEADYEINKKKIIRRLLYKTWK